MTTVRKEGLLSQPDNRELRVSPRKAVVQRRIRCLIVAILMILAFWSGFLGHTLLAAHAEEQVQAQTQPQLNRYYTSIQLKRGDTLWSIAERYREGSGYTQQEYVRELVRMNGLMTEEIHCGEYLTVMYMAE